MYVCLQIYINYTILSTHVNFQGLNFDIPVAFLLHEYVVRLEETRHDFDNKATLTWSISPSTLRTTRCRPWSLWLSSLPATTSLRITLSRLSLSPHLSKQTRTFSSKNRRKVLKLRHSMTSASWLVDSRCEQCHHGFVFQHWWRIFDDIGDVQHCRQTQTRHI